ncbi:hypothetical protein [Halomarina pelagica]|uniref:hypothetical protein n=1 Tax=Halomarina pelagica TaxID=2961599 RepID=UPI0020C462FE|nr:hypothetical protein [Halomarina sp. BND7]
MTDSSYADRIDVLAAHAARAREAFEPPPDPPDERRAVGYLREGLGPTVALYVEARTGDGPPVAFHPDEFAALERAMNDWLDLYAACYGTTLDADFTVREAATLLVETHDVRDTARVLTRVPPRGEGNR